jgi:hypothetical protein
MTMAEERKPPTGDAWRDAQREVSDRNEQARKAGREERAAYERKVAAMRRSAEAKRDIYR